MQKSTESLRRKFNKLAWRKVPTGDLCFPSTVRRAESIRHAKTDRLYRGVDEDAKDVSHDPFNDVNPEIDDMTPLSFTDDACGDARIPDDSATATTGSYLISNIGCETEQG